MGATTEAVEVDRDKLMQFVFRAVDEVLTDTLDGDGAAIDDGDVGDERPNDRRVLVGRGRLAMEGGRAGSVRLVRRAFVTASLSLLIARHGGGGGSREGVVPRAWSGERCDPLARSCWGSGAG
jgi:hypothetical protein